MRLFTRMLDMKTEEIIQFNLYEAKSRTKKINQRENHHSKKCQ